MTHTEPVTSFRGEYFALSNFAPYPTEYEGVLYPTSEHAFIAAKTLDANLRRRIAEMSTADAKVFGRTFALRPQWDSVRYAVMLAVLRDKFSRNAAAAHVLRGTDDRELIEGNAWHDNYWGDCRCESCRNIPGDNVLGKLLIQIRDELKVTDPDPAGVFPADGTS